MQKRLVLFLIGLAVSTDQFIDAQQTASRATDIFRSSLNTQAGQVTIQDVTLTGTVHSIRGADDETVPFIFKANAKGSARSEINLSSGILIEVRQIADSGSSGAWLNSGSTPHEIVGHNLMTDAAWFFPLFIVQRLLSDQNAIVTLGRTEGGTLLCQSVQAPASGLTQTVSKQIQHLSEIDLYLDSTSLVPVGLFFNLHPDNNALVDIPVYIQFSNYQQTNGINVPMRVQKYVNNVLAMDIQVQNVTFNTGLNPAEFTAQ